jgi:polysaccharide biosynthesis protein PslH
MDQTLWIQQLKNQQAGFMQKKILFISPGVPLPPTGGGTRSFHILKAAAASGIVDLIVFEPVDSGERDQLSIFCNSITDQPAKTKPVETFLWKFTYRLCLVFPFLFSASTLNHEIGFFVRNRMLGMPFLRSVYFAWLLLAFRTKKELPSIAYQLLNKNKVWKRQLADKLKSPYDVLIIDFSYMGFLLQQINTDNFKKIIVNTHNVEHRLVRQSAAHAFDAIEAKWIELQASMIGKAELDCLKIADHVLCCSKEDQLQFSKIHAAAIAIVPNGVDLEYYKPTQNIPQKPMLLFTGTMNYGPNIDAVKWFIPEVFVPLQKKYPLLRLVIAGRKADQLGFNGMAGVVIENDPPDMRPFFEEAQVVVVPLRQGSGTRLKILEAAAMQKTVISTKLGAEGLDGLTDDMIRFSDTPSEFIQSLKELLEDRCLGKKMATNIHNWVVAHYSWESIRKQVETLLK